LFRQPIEKTEIGWKSTIYCGATAVTELCRLSGAVFTHSSKQWKLSSDVRFDKEANQRGEPSRPPQIGMTPIIKMSARCPTAPVFLIGGKP